VHQKSNQRQKVIPQMYKIILRGCLDWFILSSFWLLALFYFGGVWERLNAFKHLLLGQKGTKVI